MFVTNKGVKLPDEISINSQISVKVVKTFKLLGDTIDNKLDFTEHCSNLKKIINRKIFSIKRLFYLATSVKIQFYKTFILPYFDYCLSLIIYFPKQTVQSLNNCFNLCLYRLFMFGPEIDYYNDDMNMEIIMNNFLDPFLRSLYFAIEDLLKATVLCLWYQKQ